MSLESDFIAKIGPAINGRMYWDEAPNDWNPADRKAPFAVVQQVGGTPRNYVTGEVSGVLNARLQVNVWGERRSEVSDAIRKIAAAVVLANNGTDFVTTVLGEPITDVSEVLGLRGSLQDFSIWYKNPYGQ